VAYEVECLHCGKRFRARRPLRGTSDSQVGFKCPHCGLLVSLPRAEEERAREVEED
jgi:DNA-directed RNA polymerase subunit RPC12/RpoP